MSIRARFRLPRAGFCLDIDLSLPGQGVSALFGPSGSGKTSLLRCLAGLERAPGGYLEMAGEPWQDRDLWVPTHRRPLAYVFQEANLFPHLDVRGNLAYGLQRIPAAQRTLALDQAVALLGISELLARRPEQLSGGERQRVAIARALATSPRLLLMDEPLAALDLARKGEILPYLERLRDELAIPIVYVSHAPDEVARLADHLVVLEAGRVLAQGPLGATLARLDLPIRLGEDAGVVLQGRILARDPQWHLAQVGFPGGELWVRDTGHELGRPVRVRLLARDLSISLERPQGTSILNCLPAQVQELAPDAHPALALVRLQAGAAPLVARVTQRSAAGLELAPGKAVWVQIKAAALIG